MKPPTIIFPHQLFRQHPALSKEREIFLVEEPLFFSGFNPRMKVMINQIDRVGKERMEEHLAIANRFLEEL